MIEPPVDSRTMPDVALTAEQIKARLAELDNMLKGSAYDFALAAENNVRSERARDLAMARAYNAAEGTPTDKRQAAIEDAGMLGTDEAAVYARLSAEFESIQQRVIIGSSLLKAANV